ncbi:MAG: phage capsid protein [Negativicutes bacterium]|nr:phage capsid protein [Negativicutes bacterium]
MSDNLYQLFTTQFSTNLELKLQQMGSKLRGKIREGTHIGKQASPINQVGAIAAKAPAGVFAPKNTTNAAFTRRWVFPQPAEIDQLIDSFEELETIVDPKSQYTENAAMAIGRAWDDSIIANSFGTAQIGVDEGGLSAETFNTAATNATSNPGFVVPDNFGASATSGLTVAKIIEAKRTFRHYHVDFDTDPLTLVIGSQQESDLLNQAQVVSTDFNDKPVLVDGKLTRFLGVDIVVLERLATQTSTFTSTTVRNCLAFAKSGLYLGLWQDLVNRVSIRNDLSSEPYDLYTKTMYGVTRTQPGKVLQIQCSDVTGADITP